MKKQLSELTTGDKFSFRQDGGAVFMITSNAGEGEVIELLDGNNDGQLSSLSDFGDPSQKVYIKYWSDIFDEKE